MGIVYDQLVVPAKRSTRDPDNCGQNIWCKAALQPAENGVLLRQLVINSLGKIVGQEKVGSIGKSKTEVPCQGIGSA